jgi:lipid-binding SYLF domain-containing protein
MKAMWCMAVAGALVAATAYAEITKDESERIQKAAQVVTALREAPDKGIPQELWEKANCVVVLPGVKKAAFGIGGEFGKGVMSCRTATGWGAPAFMELAKGSFGFQIGAQEADLILLVMNRRGIDKMLKDQVSLGADASVAAGPVGRTGAAATDLKLNAEILSYSRSRGLFAGIDVSGGVLRPDKDANVHSYGANVAAYDVVLGSTVTTPTSARVFVNALGTNVRATTGVK